MCCQGPRDHGCMWRQWTKVLRSKLLVWYVYIPYLRMISNHQYDQLVSSLIISDLMSPGISFPSLSQSRLVTENSTAFWWTKPAEDAGFPVLAFYQGYISILFPFDLISFDLKSLQNSQDIFGKLSSWRPRLRFLFRQAGESVSTWNTEWLYSGFAREVHANVRTLWWRLQLGLSVSWVRLWGTMVPRNSVADCGSPPFFWE